MKKIISRWISAILIFLSLLLIFVPWLSTDNEDSIESIVSIIRFINSLSEEKFEGSAIKDIDQCINDGKISAFESFKANIDIKKVVSSYNDSFGELTNKDETIMKMCTADTVIFVVTIVLGIVALIYQIVKPNFLTPLLYFLSEIVFVFWGLDATATFFEALSDALFLELSINYTTWSYISLLLVFTALITSFVFSNKEYKFSGIWTNVGKKIIEDSKPGWSCPRCGNKNKPNYNYCDHCGLQKTGDTCCKNCGGPITASQTFCPHCGTKING